MDALTLTLTLLGRVSFLLIRQEYWLFLHPPPPAEVTGKRGVGRLKELGRGLVVGGMFAMGWEALLTLAADHSLEPHAVIISIIQTELKMLDFFSKIISFFRQ